MRDTTAVHDLHEDAATFGVNRFSHLFPDSNLLVGSDTRGAHITLAHGRRENAFGDDQAGTGALSVISNNEVTRDAVVIGTRASHRCHDEAIGQRVATDLNRGEEWAHGFFLRWLACVSIFFQRDFKIKPVKSKSLIH